MRKSSSYSAGSQVIVAGVDVLVSGSPEVIVEVREELLLTRAQLGIGVQHFRHITPLVEVDLLRQKITMIVVLLAFQRSYVRALTSEVIGSPARATVNGGS